MFCLHRALPSYPTIARHNPIPNSLVESLTASLNLKMSNSDIPLASSSSSPQSSKERSPTKRTRKLPVEIPLCEKLESLQRIHLGCPRSTIAQELGIDVSTINGWVKNENAIQKWAAEHNGVMPRTAKRIKKSPHELIDRAMWLWHRERSAAGGIFTGHGTQIQALIFWNQLNMRSKFSASDEWLARWQRRYGVELMTQRTPRAATSAPWHADQPTGDELSVDEYKAQFAQTMAAEGLTADQVFFCDVIGLNCRQLPELVRKVAGSPDGHRQTQMKERVTLMACSNASGTWKLPLVVVGKCSEPSAMNDIGEIPVWYRSQVSAYVTVRFFRDWFNKEFYPSVKEFLISKGIPPQAILYMNNCLSLPQKMKKQKIRVEFLPHHVAAWLQTFDRGWLKDLKVSYRQQLMKFIITRINAGDSLDEAMNNVSIREVVFWTAMSWNQLPIKMMVESWKPLWPEISTPNPAHLPVELFENWQEVLGKEEEYETKHSDSGPFHRKDIALTSEFCDALSRTNAYQSINIVDIEKWLYPKTKITEDECLSKDEIMQITWEDNDTNLEIEAEPAYLADEPQFSPVEAQDSLNKVIEYCSSNPHYSTQQRLSLIAIRTIMQTEMMTINPATTPVVHERLPRMMRNDFSLR
ncbi:jerky protein homolog-like [Diachasmimorpha longicaudata]|uniref:jerky protein homolog-like n=1 Tax=Diachasmimorpha longicaudata TaxID=58733 RepID=UPI0030B8D435